MSTILLSLPIVQTSLAQKATNYLNETYGTNIFIEKVRLSPFRFSAGIKGVYVEDYQKDTLIYIDKLTTSLLNIRRTVKGDLHFDKVGLDELFLNLKTYKGAKDTNLDVFINKLDDGKPRAEGTPPFYMASDEVRIFDGRFKLIDENLAKTEVLNFNELNSSVTDFKILGPEVTLDIQDLSLKSSRNIPVIKLATSFTYTKQQMRFDSLFIETKESHLKGKLLFNYDRKDLSDFENKVNVSANFIDSKVGLNDVNKFYNEFGKNKEVEFSGEFSGTLNALEVKDLALVTGYTGIRGDFEFKNLFEDSSLFKMDASLNNVTSSYYQLRALMPRILGENIPKSFEKIGQFTVRGQTTVTENTLNVEANIRSELGDSYADLTMSELNKVDNAAYEGFISLIDFDLGTFLKKEDLGFVSLDLNVKGNGFIAENLNTQASGEIYSIQYNNYNYQNLKIAGVLKDQLFDGSLIANDDNLKLDFTGLVDFRQQKNKFRFTADAGYVDFNKLNFMKDEKAIFKGTVAMDVVGNTIDNLEGEINFTNTEYQNPNDTYQFKDFKVSSVFQNDSIRNITVTSPDIIEGYLKGNFKVNELGKLMRNAIGSVYTNYNPFEVTDGQQASFNFNIYNKIVEVFYPDVKFGPETFIRGKITTNNKDFNLRFESPSIEAFKNKFEQVVVKIDNNNPLFNTYVEVKDMNTVYYDVKDFQLINTTLSDTLFFRTEFKGGSSFNDRYNLSFYHTFNKKNNSVIGLKKSDVNIKGTTWFLNQQSDLKNKIEINRTLDSISIDEIVMNNERDEQIRLRGQLADSTYKNLELEFKQVSLEKITPNIDSLKLAGTIDGFLTIVQLKGNYLPSSSLDVTNFRVNDIGLGNLQVSIFGNKDLTEFGVNSWLANGANEQLNLSGKVFNKNNQIDLDLFASFSNFKLEPFAPLGEDVIANIRGLLNGNVSIKGKPENPSINGLLTLNQAGLGIHELNVDYSFDPFSRVRLEDQTFYFENIGISDVKMNTKATLNGLINHYGFGNWYLNLNVATNNDRFLILNTPNTENALYYGDAFVNGRGRIFGPTSGLNITFDGATARGTSLKIPLNDVTSVGDYSFINFIDDDTDNTIEIDRKLTEYQGLEMEFDLAVTPDAEVEIVVDQEAGSSLKGTGEGILLMEINTNGKFNMYGDFVVVTGEYNYRLPGLIDKRFKVRPGGDITWDGDPLAAQINMEALYSLTANPDPLLDNSGYTGRIPTDVVVQLQGELESPQVKFNIEFPSSSSVIKSELEYRLQDPTIEERNAFFLLAQGTFFNPETGLNQQALTGNLIQSASGILNQILGSGNDKFDFGVSYEQGTIDPNADFQTENRIGVEVSTQISDRVLVNGKVGVPVGGVSGNAVAGDVEVQVLLNEDGTLRTKIFNRENEIQQFLSENQGYTQGVGLSYQVDFNNFKELLRKITGRKQEDTNIRQAPVVKKAPPPTNVMGKDSLVRFTSKND